MFSKRILVTGCGGFVGGAIIHQARGAYDVHALSRGDALAYAPGITWHTIDLTDGERLNARLDRVRPEAVIHAAAIANIDYCESNRAAATRVNVTVTEHLAAWCEKHGARMIYISTDNVFDGAKGGYTEDDPPSPINVYAETKVAAEHVVASLARDWVVVRPSVVMGLPMLGAGNSFLSRMIPEFEAGRAVYVPDNEIRTPIDVVSLARALLELAGHTYSGYLHLAGNDILNRYEMACRIAAALGYRAEQVIARNPDWIAGRAPRPLNASLCNRKAGTILQTPMRGIEEGLTLVLSERKVR